MKAWNGMITKMEEIEEIKKNGKREQIEVARTDRDGWNYTEKKMVYTYEGTHYEVTTDRDGWPIAWVVA